MPFYEKQKSKLKMVVLTAHGEENITRYSPVHQNKKNNETIMQGMLRRLKDNFTAGKLKARKIQVIQFYENGSCFYKMTVNWSR